MAQGNSTRSLTGPPHQIGVSHAFSPDFPLVGYGRNSEYQLVAFRLDLRKFFSTPRVAARLRPSQTENTGRTPARLPPGNLRP